MEQHIFTNEEKKLSFENINGSTLNYAEINATNLNTVKQCETSSDPASNEHNNSASSHPPTKLLYEPISFELKETTQENISESYDASFEVNSNNSLLKKKDDKETNNENSIPPYTPVKVLGHGTYGVVYKAYDEKSQPVALKVINFTEESDGIPSTVLREISLLKELTHPNIIQLLRIRSEPHLLVLVFELSDCDLRYYLDVCMQPLSSRRVKSFMYQLLQAMIHVHSFKILHRDLKPQNLLLNEDGTLKVADFGLARAFSVPVREFAHEVVTLWYRAPDVLLGNQNYSTGVDMWSVGCIFAEMLEFHPLFSGSTKEEHLAKIFEVLGTPTLEEFSHHEKFVKGKLMSYMPQLPKQDLAKLLPHADKDAIDLLKQLLVYDGEKRLAAAAALQHPYFTRTPFQKKIPLRLEFLKQRKKLILSKLVKKN